MLGELAVLYLFLGGAGAGSIAVCSVVDLVSVRQPFGTSAYEQGPAADPRARALDWGFLAGLVILAAGVACLMLDVGRADRVLSLFLSPRPSVMALGAFALAALLALGGFLAAVRLLYLPAVPRAAVAVAEAASVAVGAVVMAYTGVLLATLGGVALWATPWLPALFTLSSTSSGIAVAVIAAHLADEGAGGAPARTVVALARADAAVVALEAVCAAGFVFAATGSANPGAQAGAEALLLGGASWAWWLGFCGCGMALPLAVDVLCAGARLLPVRACALAAVLALAGALALRVAVAEAGVHREMTLGDPVASTEVSVLGERSGGHV